MRRFCALAVALLPSCALAKDAVTCIKVASGQYVEPATLGRLLQCHQNKLDAATAAYIEDTKQGPPETVIERWRDRQRAEVNAYLSRHPERASADDPPPSPEGPKAPPAAAKAGSGDTKEFEELNRKLRAKSDGGKDGVTPEMARDVNDYLMKSQGSVSPDMRQFLDSLQRDGGKLSDGSVGRLKSAAQEAKGQGLDLNTDAKTEEFLLGRDNPSLNSN